MLGLDKKNTCRAFRKLPRRARPQQILAITIMIKLLTTRSLQIIKRISHETDTFHELLDPRKIPQNLGT